jgi:hypothetical protein
VDTADDAAAYAFAPAAASLATDRNALDGTHAAFVQSPPIFVSVIVKLSDNDTTDDGNDDGNDDDNDKGPVTPS